MCIKHQNGFLLKLNSGCGSSELTPQITSEGNSKIPTNFRTTIPPQLWVQIWNCCTSRKSLERNTLSTLKNAGKKEINFYVNDQNILTDKSKLRFHSPLNLQVLAFPLAAWSCCVIKQNVCIRTTACFEMFKDWIVFYPFYHRVKNSSVFLKFIRCW